MLQLIIKRGEGGVLYMVILELISVGFITLVGIYFFKKYAELFGLVDIPNDRSMHSEKKVSATGIVFIVSPLLILFIFHIDHILEYYYIYLSIILVLIVGIWDDLRDVSPKVKFVFIFIATFLLYINDFAIYSLGTYINYEFVLPVWMVFPFTFFAMAGYTNALNLMDGLDGLAASLSLVILSTFFAIGWEHHDKLLMILPSFYIVALLAFLVFNWYPATVFMGDSGSLTLGTIIVILTIQSVQYITPVSVLFIIAIPLLDTFIVMTRRIQRHQSPFKADKNHMHHLLYSVKNDIRYTVIILTMMQIVFSIIGYQVSKSSNLLSLILFSLLFFIYLNLFDQRLKRRQRQDDNTKK
jgi:UDP-GlcNAc:undecaprenyl-phosphate GlcNAc-1-phosphate transferase